MKVVIIGGGLFGSIAAASLRLDGHDVTVVDANKSGAGSHPAACLMKPSWFGSMGKDKFEPSLELLDRLYGVKDLQMSVGPARATVHWCDPAQILRQADLHDEVTDIMGSDGEFLVELSGGGLLSAQKVIVAAGVWSSKLVPIKGLVGRAGVAFRWKELQLPGDGFIRPWAPYRQTVGFNISSTEVWVGDGSAIKPENWNEARQDVSYARCAAAIGRQGLGDLELERAEARYGIRPYIKDAKPCLVQELRPGLWVNTGGAKNGTIAAGYSASVLRGALQ